LSLDGNGISACDFSLPLRRRFFPADNSVRAATGPGKAGVIVVDIGAKIGKFIK
jgi:hypothetical protein